MSWTEKFYKSFPLYGEQTIAEIVQQIEALAPVKVTRADLENDIVVLTIEPIPELNTEPEHEECFECGAPGTYHEDWCPYNEA